MTGDVRALLFCFIVLLATCEALRGPRDYQVPTPRVEALNPKGFRVILKDDGYSFFGFRGNINKEFEILNEGDIKKDVLTPKGGYWIYKNRDVKLEIGDVIYYWIYIIKDKMGYMNTDLDYTVTGFIKEAESPIGGNNQNGGFQFPENPTPEPEPILDERYGNTGVSCENSITMVQGKTSVCKGVLIFNEEFDKTNLKDLVEWDAEIKFPIEPDYPFNVYIPDKTVTVEGGSLVITPKLTEELYHEGFLYESLDLSARCTGRATRGECKQVASGAQILPPVVTAKISSRRSFNFKFGKIEVRAKLPSGSWLIPEISLEPTDQTYGSDHYESGVMHVAYARGNPSLAKKLYGGPVLSDKDPFRSKLLQEKIGIDNWYKDFHNYTMVWRHDGIDLLVDGEQYGSVNPGEGFYHAAKMNGVTHATPWLKGTVMAPLDEMFHVTLGLRVGGVNDFADNLVDKPWKNRASKAMLDFWKKRDSWQSTWYNSALMVDFIRVYAL